MGSLSLTRIDGLVPEESPKLAGSRGRGRPRPDIVAFMNWPWLLSPFPLSSEAEERGIKLWNA